MVDGELVTDIGAPAAKPFGMVRAGRPSIDTTDFDALRSSAHYLADASPRELMHVSLNEARALYRLAAIGADTLQLAADLVVASDTAMPRAEVEARLAALVEFVRPHMEATKCPN